LLVSSHLLAELEHVADWLVVIADGRLVHAGPATELHGRVAPQITLGAADDHALAALAQLLSTTGYAMRRDGDRLVVSVDGHEPRQLAAQLNVLAADAGIVLAELHVSTPNLEATYLDLVQGASR
jgi:ABC-2 type transport system ATP-binding protein